MLQGTQISVLLSFPRNPNMSNYYEQYFPHLVCECCRLLLSIAFAVVLCHQKDALLQSWSWTSFYSLNFILCVWVFCWLECLHITYRPCAQGGQQTASDPWNWSFMWMWAAMWGLRIEHRYSARATNALYLWATHLSSPSNSLEKKAFFCSLLLLFHLSLFLILFFFACVVKRLNADGQEFGYFFQAFLWGQVLGLLTPIHNCYPLLRIWWPIPSLSCSG